jgi:hypothetical protein
MRALALATFAAALLAAGCDEPFSSIPPKAEALRSAVAASAEVPFNGNLEGSVTVIPLQPGRANVTIEAEGNANHLGKFTLVAPHVVTFATRTGIGTYTFTAANGDQVFASFTGQALTSPPNVVIVENATITGGTGRFAGATGSFVVTRLFDQTAGTTSGTFEGTISSPGASKH